VGQASRVGERPVTRRLDYVEHRGNASLHDVCVTGSEWQEWWRRSGEADLRALVMEQWDPIGVAAFEEAASDEYDDYLGPIASRLRREASAEEALARYLHDVRTDRMGLPADEQRDLAAAKAIAEWYVAAGPSF